MRIKVNNREVEITTLFSRMVRGVVAAKVSRLLFLKPTSHRAKRIVFFGHNFNGNLRSFAKYIQENTSYEIAFMTDDPKHFHAIKSAGLLGVDKVLLVQRLRDLKYAARSEAIVTSHGYIYLREWLQAPTDSRPLFIDTWHGVPYKGDRIAAFRKLADYDMNFVSSELIKDFYVKAGVNKSRVAITGYARTDELVNLNLTSSERKDLLKSYDLPTNEGRRISLLAPTWNEKTQEEIFPFDMSGDAFLKAMDGIAAETNTLFLFRPHLNSDWTHSHSDYSKNVRIISASTYPDAESLLKIADILITDWSSITLEFLALKRPILFIDNEPSFGNYIAPLTREDRPGAKVNSITEFQDQYTKAITHPTKYLQEYREDMDRTTNRAWSSTLDGKSCERYYMQLSKLIESRRHG